MSVEIELDKTVADISKSETITAKATVVGGVAPYDYDWEWISYDGEANPAYFGWTAGTQASTDTAQPKVGVRGRVTAYVTDSRGERARFEASYTLTGGPVTEPLRANIQLSNTTADITKNETISATWGGTGGKPPYKYDFQWGIVDVGYEEGTFDCVLINSSDYDTSSTYTPKYGVEGRLRVWVEDALGLTREEAKTFTITGDNTKPLSLSATLSAQSVQAGSPLTGQWTATGGTPPLSLQVYMARPGRQQGIRGQRQWRL